MADNLRALDEERNRQGEELESSKRDSEVQKANLESQLKMFDAKINELTSANLQKDFEIQAYDQLTTNCSPDISRAAALGRDPVGGRGSTGAGTRRSGCLGRRAISGSLIKVQSVRRRQRLRNAIASSQGVVWSFERAQQDSTKKQRLIQSFQELQA